MAVKYSLHPNNLKGNEGTYYAQVMSPGTVELKDILKQVKRSGSSVSESDFLAVYHELEKAVIHFLENGYTINTSLFKLKHSISGKFKDSADKFRKGENIIKARLEPGIALVKATKLLKAEKTSPNIQRALILEYRDISSGDVNSTITPGNMATVYGKNLKVDREDDEQGIFFVDQKGDRIKVEVIAQNSNKNLVFLNPTSLISGTYHLEIAQRITNNKVIRPSFSRLTLLVK